MTQMPTRCSYEPCGQFGPQVADPSENNLAILNIISRAIAPGEWKSGDAEAGIVDESFSAEAQRLTERWEHLVRLKAGSDSRAFTRRLHNLGLDEDSVSGWLHPRLIGPADPLPRWALLAKEVLQLPPEAIMRSTALTEEFTEIEKEFLQCDPQRDIPL